MTIRNDNQIFDNSRRTFLLLTGATGLTWLSGYLPGGVAARQFEEGEYGNGSGADDNAEYEAYSTVVDDTQTFQMDIPDEWAETQSQQYNGDPGLICAPDLDAFLQTWDVPGVEVWVSTTVDRDLNAVLDANSWIDQCSGGGQIETTDQYSDDSYTMVKQTYGYCGTANAEFTHVAQKPADESFVVFFSFAIIADRDHQAAEQIVASFELISSY